VIGIPDLLWFCSGDLFNKLKFGSPPQEIRAGAKDLAGFIEAPEIKARKKISKSTMSPITIPLKPLNPLV